MALGSAPSGRSDRGRPVVGGEQGVVPVEQLGFPADLGVEECPAAGGILALDGRPEQDLDSLSIDRHAISSGKSLRHIA